MAPVSLEQPAIAKPTELLEQRFRRLESQWTAATGYLSDPDDIVNHSAFQEIIKMGEAVVPFMVRDLQEKSCLWVWALPDITGNDPVTAAEQGNITKMSAAWLSWGKEHGYQW